MEALIHFVRGAVDALIHPAAGDQGDFAGGQLLGAEDVVVGAVEGVLLGSRGIVFNQSVLQHHENVAVGQALDADRVAADGDILDDVAFVVADGNLGALEFRDHYANLALFFPNLRVHRVVGDLKTPFLVFLVVEFNDFSRHAAADHAVLLLHDDRQPQERRNLVELGQADGGIVAEPLVPGRETELAGLRRGSQRDRRRLVARQPNQDFLDRPHLFGRQLIEQIHQSRQRLLLLAADQGEAAAEANRGLGILEQLANGGQNLLGLGKPFLQIGPHQGLGRSAALDRQLVVQGLEHDWFDLAAGSRHAAERFTDCIGDGEIGREGEEGEHDFGSAGRFFSGQQPRRGRLNRRLRLGLQPLAQIAGPLLDLGIRTGIGLLQADDGAGAQADQPGVGFLAHGKIKIAQLVNQGLHLLGIGFLEGALAEVI